ncbi:hypothetical protein EHS13_25755 [Paenibacillus psychroresistens]|uniref:Uncharacterized protein n=1 Tax=Paenibacillus psychroresistens TaxID=1778678 RepID=A0A6B8RR82_9BACL|nr:hypothetical protein [Paenibacillus psychroresistens]QGQ98055.1 hypothetical protein EHS13_25755 [Paenibacillus psychroresistens]
MNKEVRKINFNWKYIIIGLIMLSLIFLIYNENQNNKKYESYLSQELSNKYCELIGYIFSIKEELTSLLNNKSNSTTKEILADRLYKTSTTSQDFDYFISYFNLDEEANLQNKTATVSNNLGFYFQRNDFNNISNQDNMKLNKINELVDKWISVISKEYPGIASENQTETIRKHISNKESFIKEEKWMKIMIGLDNVSREYEGISRSE